MRVAICQSVLPAYRLPVFQRLGEQAGMELTVFADEGRGSLRSVRGAGSFRHVCSRVRHWRVLGREFHFQTDQLSVADPRRFAAIILSWDIHYLSLLPAMGLAKLRGVPVVLWGHGYSKAPHPFTEALRNRVGRMADAVLLYNQTAARRLIERDGFGSDRVFVAQNAIDQEPIQRARTAWLATPGRLADFQARHRLDPRSTVIFVSRLQASKSVDLLFHAMEKVRQSSPEAKLVIVGDGPERARLEALARSLGQEGQVIFTGAIYQEDEIAPWMLSASICIYPKSMGLSLLHSFGYGLPVITSNNFRFHGPEIEAFIDGETGLFYRDGDVEDMVARWESILGDPQRRSLMSARALSRVLEEYNLERMVQGFEVLARVRGIAQ